MIALDSSALIAYLQGESGGVPDAVEVVLAGHQACLPPVVLTEVTSDSKVGARVLTLVAGLPLLTVGDGYWARAGELRRRVMSGGHKARLADTLIAQSCLDHDVPLLTADRDVQRFARATGLRLA